MLHLLVHEVVGLVGVRGEGGDLQHGSPHHVQHPLEARAEVGHAVQLAAPRIGAVGEAVVHGIEPALGPRWKEWGWISELVS